MLAGREEIRLAAELGLTVEITPGASRREHRRQAKAALTQARSSFRMKPLQELTPPALSRQRFAGLLVLRSYLLIALILAIVKIVGSAVK